MPNSPKDPADEHRVFDGDQAAFSTTLWSVVLQAGQGDMATAALERLCRIYWYPIYAFIRRRGSNPHDAEDLTQGFFAYLLEKETFKKADKEKGKFRSFLLAALINFLNNEWDKKQTLKRGGHHQVVSLDEIVAEERYRHEPMDSSLPERLFERRWALALLEETLARLKQEYQATGKTGLFIALEPFITGEVAADSYSHLALELNMREETIRVALSRLRRRFGELLRSEIAHTVAQPSEVDDEIRQLFSAIS